LQEALTVEYTGTVATITVMGELDIAVVDDVRDTVKRVVAHEGLTAMHLDVARVRFIDSAGLMILVRARQVALDSLLAFTLATEQYGPVDRLIDLCGFDGFFADKPPDGRPEFLAGNGV
jgi:anti-anti-sigma factor